MYLTLNVVILPHEMERALSLVDEAWAAGVDAVIVQDLGLMRVIRETIPHVRVHASTQVDAHSGDTVRALARLGVARITLARETSLSEIADLVLAGLAAGVEVESFAHGALCVCYSGQCLLSSLIGGRSANRGLCAQPCRLPYELVDEAGSVLSSAGAHLLSPKDLASISVLPALVSTGAAALKIEGRMKSPEYVALVTGVYRKALDRALELGDAYEVRDGETSVLAEAFSRGFSEAYLIGERGNEMMSYRRPNNRGVPVGRIASLSDNRAMLVLDLPVDAEDTIEVWTSQGRFAQRVGPLSFSGAVHRSAPAGIRVTIGLEARAGVGDRVFRVRNAALLAAAARTFEDTAGREIDLDISVEMVIGEPSGVTVTDASGRSGHAVGVLVEPARTRPVTSEDVAEHVGRLGGTPYRARRWDVALSPGAGIGFSELHRLRREAVAAYEHEVLSEWSSRASSSLRLPSLGKAAERVASPLLVVSVLDVKTAHACIVAGADSAHVPSWAFSEGEEAPDGVTPSVPRVCHDSESPVLHAAALKSGRGVAGTLGTLQVLADAGAHVESHWSLNALNAHAVEALAEMGASTVWLSPELSARQIADVVRVARVHVGTAVAGRQELMVTEHCVLMSEGDCAAACSSCARRTRQRFLKDRKGYLFPVVTDVTGRTHIYNSVPLDLTASIAEVLTTGVAALRVDAESETTEGAVALVRRVVAALEAHSRGASLAKPSTPTTSGHFYRGVS